MQPLYSFLGFVLPPSFLLAGLVWWRFYGGGRLMPDLPEAWQGYACVRTFRYDVSDYAPAADRDAEADGEYHDFGALLQTLVEDTEGPGCARDEVEEPTGESSSIGSQGVPSGAPPWGEEGEPAQAEGSPTTPSPAPGDTQGPWEAGEGQMPPSLLYNPVTAPSAGGYDTRNRQALSEHRSRRGAMLRAGLGAQREALGELFDGGFHPTRPPDTQAPEPASAAKSR